ncbi:MAG: hypothetical protein IAG10_24675 [Planctomycetaceae bacterium]|nr:hypothetical protein [Planctomycetaceae bacterium]
MSDEVEDVDAHIQELETRIDDVRSRGLVATASRLSRELKRFAKQEHRVIAYLKANFYLMNEAQSLHDPEAGKAAALENIALLESEELARQHQPDFPEDGYRHTVAWMSACSYDNLAKHVAETEGYNSDGIHECINDGLQVCRRTGKMECTACFREYAGDVYRASDDLDMAIHYARAGLTNIPREGGADRRWVSGKELTKLLALTGQLSAAIDTLLQAFSFIESYHCPHDARLFGSILLETLLWLAGREAEWPVLRDRVIPAGVEFSVPSAGENPSHELESAFRDVVIAACRRDLPAAIELLTRMDRLLLSRQCHSTWFDVRLRLIALQLMADNKTQAQALGKQLEAKAKPARDWLALRRLKRLLSGEVPPTPIAAVGAFLVGPFATISIETAKGVRDTSATNSEAPPTSQPAATDAHSTPLASRVQELQQACQEADTPEKGLAVFQEILAIDPNAVTVAEDAGRFAYMAHLMASRLERSLDAWRWAEPFVARFAQDATAINVLATLAWAARSEAPEGEADAIVTLEQIEKWYRSSLDMNPDHPRNHARAGQFFWSLDRESEAERCWARSFRLNRSDSRVAVQLARVYDATDRRADGLAVLDMCIREGINDPDLFWDAGLSALTQQRWELVITYLDRFEELSPETPWTQYYRALALLELHRPADALAALELETARSPEQLFGVTILRAKACADLNDLGHLRSWLTEILDVPISAVDYLSFNGFLRLFEKLIAAVQVLPIDDSQRQQIEALILQTGLMPEAFFEPTRKATPATEGLNFYVVEVRQPLDERWAAHPGRFAGQEEWLGYVASWGALAPDEESAQQWALAAQARCFPLPGEVVNVIPQGEGYTDSPGITWQGRRDEIVDPETLTAPE